MHRLRTRLPGEGVQILTRRPCPEGFFTHLGEHPSWGRSRQEKFLAKIFLRPALGSHFQIARGGRTKEALGRLLGKAETLLRVGKPCIELEISFSHFYRAEVLLSVSYASFLVDRGDLLQS